MGTRCLLGEINQELWLNRFQVFSYRVKQEKSSLIKVGEKNLWFCRLEVGGPVGRQIPIRQTVEVYNGDFLGFFEVFPESCNGKIVREFIVSICSRDLVA